MRKQATQTGTSDHASDSLPWPYATNVGDVEIGRGEFRDSISHVAFRPGLPEGANMGAFQKHVASVTMWDGEVLAFLHTRVNPSMT